MARRVFHTEESLKKENQYEQIFSAMDLICNIIIESGSFTSFTSKEIVDKLKLPTILHPKIYSLQWFYLGSEVKL